MSGTEHEILPKIPGFRLEREIGRGSTSRVFLARQESLDRPVALKIIAALGEKGQRRALRLFREARLAGALDHPGIVRGIDAGSEAGLCWFAMEYVEGRDLELFVRERGPLPVPRVLDLAEQVLAALDHAHRRGVVHRDIKPANILIDARGRARLLDLGLARRERDPRLTLDSGTLGTPLYMSPEHARSPDRVDGRSDLFSAASTFYLALTGKAPFEAPTVTAVITRLLYDEPAPPSTIVDGIPEAVDLVLLKALSKPRHLRYADAAHFLSDVRALRHGGRPALPGPSAIRRIRRPLVAGAIVVLAAGGVAWLAWPEGRRSGGDPRPVPAAPAGEEERRAAALAGLERFGVGRTDLGGLDACRRVRELRAAAGIAPDDDPGGILARVDGELLRALSERVAGLEAEAKAAAPLPGEDPDSGNTDAAGAPDVAKAEAAAAAILGCDPPDARVSAFDPVLAGRVAAVRAPAHQRTLSRIATFREHVERDALLMVGARKADLPLGTQEEAAQRTLREHVSGLIPGLDAAARARIDAAIVAAAREVGERPRVVWKEVRARVDVLIESRRWRDARRAVEEGHSVAVMAGTHAGEEALAALAAIDRGAAADLERLQAGLACVRRRNVDPMDSEEQAGRVRELAAVVDEFRDRIGQVEGAAAPFELADSLVRAGAEAAGLRAAMAAAAVELGGPEGPVLRPVHLGKVHSPRRLGAVDPEGRVVFVRGSDGARFAYAVRDLGIGTLSEILSRAGAEPSPAAVALLAYWESDEAEASARAEAVTDPGLKSFLSGLAASGTDAKSRRFETAREREAFVELQRCRHLVATGRPDEAREVLKKIAAGVPKGPHGASSFWADFRTSRPDIEGHLGRDAVLAPWNRLRPHLTTADEETGMVRLETTLRDGGGVDAWEAPAGIRSDAAGLLVPMPPEERLRPPAGRPLLRLPLPDLAGAEVSVRFTVAFDGDEPPAYLGIALHDLCFLGVARLAHGEAFRGEPLHGREHGLFSLRTFEKAAVWAGGFDQPGPHLRSAKLPFRPQSGTDLLVSIEVRDRGRSAAFVVGPERYELPPGQEPKLAGEGLRILACGAIRIRDVSCTVRHAPGGAGR